MRANKQNYHIQNTCLIVGRANTVICRCTNSVFKSCLLYEMQLSLAATLVNKQLDAQFFVYVYFYSLHVSGSHVPIIRRIIVSMRHLVYVTLKQVNSLKLQKVMP